MKSGWKRGTVLLQTLVMSVILSMIAVMLMKWVLARYMMAARNYRSGEAKAHSEYFASSQLSNWNIVNYPSNFNTLPTNGTYTNPSTGKVVNYSRTSMAGGAPMTVTITADED